MRRASLLVVPCLFIFGCTRTVDPRGAHFQDRKTTPAPTATLVAKDSDDGFGSAVAVYDGDVWVGAPHGTEGRSIGGPPTTSHPRSLDLGDWAHTFRPRPPRFWSAHRWTTVS